LARYGSLTGLIHLSAGGPASGEMLSTAWNFPWISSLAATARAAVWTGNNSDTAFNARTVSVALALVAAAAGCWLWSAMRRRWPVAERVLAAGVACYAAALAYVVVLFYWASGGAAIAA